MGTRAAAFTAKIKNLQDAQIRLMQASPPSQSGGAGGGGATSSGSSGSSANSQGPPSGTELATTLKWFSNTLLNVLKDVPGQPFIMMKSQEHDQERMALFPSLDYKGLYSTLLSYYDLIPSISQGLYDFGKAYLNTLCALVPFLERELIDTLPYMVCAMLPVLPASLSQDIINVVCWNLIPFTINSRKLKDNLPLTEEIDLERDNYASRSAAAVLMMVFQFAKDNTAIHRQITEALMSVKEDLVKDLLCVVAHGTPPARTPAAHLLFYYWPSLNPTLFDLKGIINKFNNSDSWTPPLCTAPECAGKGNALAVNMCLDHTICMSHHPDRPPPGFYCRDCFLTIQRLIDGRDVSPMFQDMCHPMGEVNITCDNQKCKSLDKTATAICFSQDCASFNGTDHRPTRYCTQCNKINHQSRLTLDHVIHSSLPSPWDMDQETQNYLVKAVVSLLQEAKPFGSSGSKEQEEAHRRTMQVISDDEEAVEDEATQNDRRLLSRYGVWLLIGLSTPNKDTHLPTFGHMLSMLFQWFSATSYLPSDKIGATIEKLKSEYCPEWLQKVYKDYPEVFVSCLLPNPPDWAKVGGHWDMFLPRIDHIKEGLTRFFCLVPYDVITLEVWDKVMSHWLEAINKEVNREEISELKSIFCKTFDPDMSPLGFDAKEMYGFISKRFKRTLPEVQQQALQWLQKLCLMNIHIPLEIMFEMFNDGIDTLHDDGANLDPEAPGLILEATSGCKSDEDILGGNGPTSSNSDNDDLMDDPLDPTNPLASKEELNLICYNLMIDVLTSQMEQQDIEKHVGLLGPKANSVLAMINKMLATPWMEDINKCLADTLDFEDLEEDEEFGIRAVEELLTDFLQLCHITIRNIISLDTGSAGDSDDDTHDTVHTTIHAGDAPEKSAAMKKAPGLGQFMAVLSTMQSTVETAKEADDSSSESSQEDSDEPFVLKIEDYNIPLQLVYHLLLRNTQVADADMRFYLLDSVRLMAMNAEVLQSAARKQKRFIQHCQDPLLTGVLWAILDAAHSQVAQAAVPIILHSITLPGGADIFWRALDDDFNSEDWRVRFSAVEKVTLMFRFLEERPLKKSHALRSVLSHAFCCLICSMDDINVHISQRSTLHLGTIHDSALKTLMWSLEYQFDTVPIDRPVILKRLYQLYNCLIERRVLSWSFFANRFDVVIAEIQAAHDTKPDITGGTNRQNASSAGPNNHPSHVKKSTSLAMAATAETNVSAHTSLRSRIMQRSGTESVASVRSLASSLKYPYKRTISAPAGMGLSGVSKATLGSSGMGGKATGPYSRQQSVPMMLKGKYGKSLNDSGPQLNKQISNVATVLEDLEFINVAGKTLDMDEIDRESLHLLVFLFMQYLSASHQAIMPPEEVEAERPKHKKVTSIVRCFHSLYSLIGYNEAERCFKVMPHKIRSTATVNAFLANLPQVLDYNFEVGKSMLLNCVLILQKIPFPPRYAATTYTTAQTLTEETHLFQGCGFSLWYLEPSLRKNWIMSALVIFYKYDFNMDDALGQQSLGLIRIILYTLSAHAHVCDRYARPAAAAATMARSRDWSQASINNEEEEDHDMIGTNPDSPVQEASDQEDADEEDEEEEELQPIFEKAANKSDSSPSPEKPSEPDCLVQALVETNPNPGASAAAATSAESDSNVRAPMANLFGFLPRPSPRDHRATTPDTHQLTSGEGLPMGWTMQLMHNGRTLFIDNTNQATTWIDPRTGRTAEVKNVPKSSLPMFESPPSPLSLMDVITLGSPIAVDKSTSARSGTSSSSALTIASPESSSAGGQQLDAPNEERLLPIGGGNSRPKRGDQSRERIIDRVWQVFGQMEPGPGAENVPLIEERVVTSEKIQVVASIHKQDSTCSDSTDHTGSRTDTTVTECYVGTVTHLRNGFSKPAEQVQTEEQQQPQQGGGSTPKQVEVTTATPPVSITPKGTQGVVKKSSLKKKGDSSRNLEKQDSRVEVQAPGKEKPRLKKRRKQGTGVPPEHTGLQDSSSKASSVCGKNRENSSSSLLSANRDNPLLLRQSALRIGEDSIVDKCSHCGVIKEEYSEDELGHCIIVLNTLISREPALAAPLLPEILLTVSRLARGSQYSWELDSTAFIPGNSRSIARQFLRVVILQLSENGISSKLFLMEMEAGRRQHFFNTLVQCLLDFSELGVSAPVAMFMQEMTDKKTLTMHDFEICLPNLATFFKCTQFEVSSNWNVVFGPAEVFFRRLWLLTGTPMRTGGGGSSSSPSAPSAGGGTGGHGGGGGHGGKGGATAASSGCSPESTIQLPQLESLFHIMTSMLRMPGVSNNRPVLDPLAKLLSYALQNCPNVNFTQLLAICHFCNRGFIKERDKQLLTRTACYELVQAIKFKTSIPDANFLMLTNFVLLDIGGQLSSEMSPDGTSASKAGSTAPPHCFPAMDVDLGMTYITAASEVMRNHMQDVLEFLADVHTLSKVKSNCCKGAGPGSAVSQGLNEDTLGGTLKAAMSQYLALEISKGNGRDSRTVNRYLPWLFNPPGNTATQGPKEFLDCVAHIRLLSWLLLGAVNHTLKFGSDEGGLCQPIPLEASCHIADHVQVILAGFAEQSKTSVVHMCSLFHAFILCQLWTVYLEQTIVQLPNKDEGQLLASSILLDFWGKVTPGILQLVSHSKVLAEMVNLHFLSLMEAFMECHSTILAKMMPLWTPVLFAYQPSLPDHVRVRLQAIMDYKPSEVGLDEQTVNNMVLVKWLQRLQFKMGQIEMQASNVTQFFTV